MKRSRFSTFLMACMMPAILAPVRKRWEAQVDSVAVYLKQLKEAGVPVLWRPYHEMNGDWFWWGG